jgi:HAD superfamily hydrolase (TIGR01490 family)
MNLALFDLDNTLLDGDTDFEWLEFLVEQGAVSKEERLRNREMDERYRTGEADPVEYVRFYLRFYPPHAMATLLGWRTRFIRERIEPRLLPAGRELIARHRGDLAAIITATNRFLTEPIAAALGVEHLIATEPRIVDECFTGDVDGVPCMRHGKIERLEKWLQARRASLASYEQSWFYSDSVNDVPLLERVTHPVAVDPDERLRKMAEQRAWPVISLR